jgi:CDP-diacylglycerol--glycerol-3-phosphate 3-phosphatidyltransferase
VELKKDFWTLPNTITLFRLLFGAFTTIVLYNNSFAFVWLIFLLFALTDLIDGYLARKLDSVTSWGIKLDPLADQFLVLPVLWMLYWSGDIAFFAPMLLTGREIIMVLLRFFAKRDFPANIFGKAKVVAEYVGIAFLLAGGQWYLLGLLMFFPIIILALASLIKYVYDFSTHNLLTD